MGKKKEKGGHELVMTAYRATLKAAWLNHGGVHGSGRKELGRGCHGTHGERVRSSMVKQEVAMVVKAVVSLGKW